MRAFDQYGREVQVPREEWRTNVIPGMLKEAWDDADRLYAVILNSINEGFVAEMSDAATHLLEIDPIAGRGACMAAIVMAGNGRRDEAEKLLTEFPEKHGEDGSVLVNLAKIYADKGQTELANETLTRALEIEPNHDSGLGWYAAHGAGARRRCGGREGSARDCFAAEELARADLAGSRRAERRQRGRGARAV